MVVSCTQRRSLGLLVTSCEILRITLPPVRVVKCALTSHLTQFVLYCVVDFIVMCAPQPTLSNPQCQSGNTSLKSKTETCKVTQRLTSVL